MKLEKLETFVNQIEDEEKKSVPELEILFGVLTEELNTPRSDKDLDTHLTLLNLRDRVIAMLENSVSDWELKEFFKKNLRRIAIQNLKV
tara:strand:- start:2201 stop:2467 length:267 start_codon:yes stop_codon:yes gene_type:complete